MLYAGLDLSRKRLDVRVLDRDGGSVVKCAVRPDRDGLAGLAARLEPLGAVSGAVESMTGAQFVHDQLERHGWEVQLADAQKVKGLAPLACKTDEIDAWVLAELARLDLVPAVWQPDPKVRGARERARFRLHLVHHRSALKNRIHAALMAFGVPCPTADLFGVGGRRQLASLQLPDAWADSVAQCLELIDDLDRRIAAADRQLKQLGVEHRYVPLLTTIPGVAWILGYTIAAEIGDIDRFATPAKLAGYSGLCPRVYQSGQVDRRGRLSKHGPRYLRWALIEAATHAARHPAYQPLHERTRQRLGPQRGPKVARIAVARKLAHAIWHMTKTNKPFAPAAPAPL